MPAAAEGDLEAALWECTRIVDLIVEPVREVVDDLVARPRPEHRRTAEATPGDVVELAVGDLAQASLQLVPGLPEQVVRRVLPQEALEDRMDSRAAGERAELDDLFGIFNRLDAEQPVEEEAVGALCVVLEDARAERSALGEPCLERRNRLVVGERAIKGSERSLSPASPAERLGAKGCGGDPVQHGRAEWRARAREL